MDATDANIDQLMLSDLDKKREQALILSYRQNTAAINALSARSFDLQRVIGSRIEELNKVLDSHRADTTKSIVNLTKALKKADEAGTKVSKASNRLTIFLVIGTLVQAAVAIILLFKH